MGRCGCGNNGCQCSISGGDCLAVTGTGTAADPFELAPIISPDVYNQLTCRANGLYASRDLPQSAYTAAAGTTASASYTATLGGSPGTNPSVSITTGTEAMVAFGAGMVHSTTGECSVSFATSGATTQAASDDRRIAHAGTLTEDDGITIHVTGLTPGVNVFTLQYKTSVATMTVARRRIIAWAVGL